MLYDIPLAMQSMKVPKWPMGVGNIQAVLPDGTAVNLPVPRYGSCKCHGL